VVRSLLPALLLACCIAAPAQAEVTAKSDIGFVTSTTVDIPARSLDEVWQALLKPAKWWNPLHAWSGDADNLYLDAQAGGCFCELLPLPKAAAPGTRRGSIEHARVLAAMPPRLLRLTGALGPLQGEALNGTLTVVLKPLPDGGTRMTWSYVVGGFMRMKVEDIAPIVDRVLAEQAQRLAAFAQAPPGEGPASR
jgi:uncharacterized protein YndB with AHSA1/START domain